MKRKAEGGPNDRSSKRQGIDQGPWWLKVLLPQQAPGSLIGRGGSEMRNLEQTYEIAMRISGPESFFPGTTERVCIIAGAEDKLRDALPAIVTKAYEDVPQPEGTIMVRVLATSQACGGIIGRGGAETKAVTQQTGIRLQIADNTPGVAERIITMNGPQESVQDAFLMIMEKLQDNGNVSLDVEYRGEGGKGGKGDRGGKPGGGGMEYRPFPNSRTPPAIDGGGKGRGMDQRDQRDYRETPREYRETPRDYREASRDYREASRDYREPPRDYREPRDYPPSAPSPQQGDLTTYECTIEFFCEERFCGAFIGRQGSTMKRIQADTGAVVKLDRSTGDGAALRRVSVTGTVPSVHTAHADLMRLLQAEGGHSIMRHD